MIEWINIFTAEALKQKRSLTGLILILSPSLMGIFNILVGAGGYYAQMQSGADIMKTVLNNSLNLWSLIMLPIAMTLLTALNASVEFRNAQWKHIFVLPVSPWRVMMAKWIVNLGMAALSHLYYFAVILSVGFYLCTANGMSFAGSLDYSLLAQRLGITFLASLLLITIHTLTALMLDNFLIVMTFGTMMMISNYFVGQSEKYGVLSPWAHPMRLQHYLYEDPHFWVLLAANLLGSLILAMAGLKLLTKRQIYA
jgi:hypothetical protein